jgi:hypothetical protein
VLISWSTAALLFDLNDRNGFRSDMAEVKDMVSIEEIENDLETVVCNILAPLYERFDGYVLPARLVGAQLNLQTLD